MHFRLRNFRYPQSRRDFNCFCLYLLTIIGSKYFCDMSTFLLSLYQDTITEISKLNRKTFGCGNCIA